MERMRSPESVALPPTKSLFTVKFLGRRTYIASSKIGVNLMIRWLLVLKPVAATLRSVKVARRRLSRL